MKKIYDVLIIGGGISGIACAICLAKKGHKVCLVEKQDKIGKKILVTGNGRCNLSNSAISTECYNNENIAKMVFNEFPKEKVLQFWENLGLELFCDEEGRFYPVSENANSVRDCALLKLQNLNVDMICGNEVVNCVKSETSFITTLNNGLQINSRFVVCCCGGKAVENIFANNHFEFVKNKQVLLGLECLDFDKKLDGIRQNVILKAKCKEFDFCEFGNLQFREKGISGIVAFNLSFYLKKFCVNNLDITVDLLPTLTIEKLKNYFDKLIKNNGYLKIKELLLGLLPFHLAMNVTKKVFTNLEQNISSINLQDIKSLINILKGYPLKVVGELGKGQVEYSGFDMNKNFDNLESISTKNLFACGEACGMFGKSGGFNIHFAVASAMFVAEHISKIIQ